MIAIEMRDRLRDFVRSELLRKPDYPLAADEALSVDLSRWRVINAAEPVRWDGHRLFLERFLEPFGRYGLTERSLAVAYGMAEATLFVTATPIDKSPHVGWVEIRALQEGRRAPPAAPEAAGSTPMTSCGFPIEEADMVPPTARSTSRSRADPGQDCLIRTGSTGTAWAARRRAHR